jgi:ribosomal protein S12 methylthiotransferase accessory factor
VDLASRRGVLVPAQEVWFNTGRLADECLVVNRTTSGCAVATTFGEAALFALLEAIERDAFLVMWYLRRPCLQIDADAIAFEPFQLLRHRWRFAFPDYRLCLFDATCDTGLPVVVAFALRERGTGPRVFCSAAARVSAERACFTALKDLTGFRADASKRQAGGSPRRAPSASDGPDYHFEAYYPDDSIERLAFLDFDGAARTTPCEMDRRSIVRPAERYQLGEVIGRCVDHLHTIDVRVIAKDVTHAAFRSVPLRCVRVVAPGLFPMWFGHPPRFAETPRLRRLGVSLPGVIRDGSSGYNVDIHPFT